MQSILILTPRFSEDPLIQGFNKFLVISLKNLINPTQIFFVLNLSITIKRNIFYISVHLNFSHVHACTCTSTKYLVSFMCPVQVSILSGMRASSCWSTTLS